MNKIDFLYPFHFNGRGKTTAIKRLLISLESIKNQEVNICIVNTSKDCIYEHVKKYNPKYIHKESTEEFCKSLTINFGVRNLVETPYFILSDIDLVYRANYIKSYWDYIIQPKKFRIIPYNINLQLNHLQIKNVNDCIVNKDCFDKERSQFGIAPGNGLVHTMSFYFIGGFDEQIKGYGPEDADFNERIKYINEYVEDSNSELSTFHINHKLAKYTERVFNYDEQFQKRKKFLELNLKGFNFFECDNPVVLQRKKEIITANIDKEWGIV
jgi:predicted glycosyltransferase involved in capsule biosynthesis